MGYKEEIETLSCWKIGEHCTVFGRGIVYCDFGSKLLIFNIANESLFFACVILGLMLYNQVVVTVQFNDSKYVDWTMFYGMLGIVYILMIVYCVVITILSHVYVIDKLYRMARCRAVFRCASIISFIGSLTILAISIDCEANSNSIRQCDDDNHFNCQQIECTNTIAMINTVFTILYQLIPVIQFCKGYSKGDPLARVTISSFMSMLLVLFLLFTFCLPFFCLRDFAEGVNKFRKENDRILTDLVKSYTTGETNYFRLRKKVMSDEELSLLNSA